MRLKNALIVAGVAALIAVVATTVVIMVVAFPAFVNSPPDVKFIEFTSDRKQDVKVGENVKVSFNVVNHESKTFNDARVAVLIEPSSSRSYFSIDEPSIILPVLTGKESQTGQNQVTITVTGSPAKEATYAVRGILYVEGMQTDVKEFDLKIRQ